MKIFGINITTGCHHKWDKYGPPVNGILCEGSTEVGYFQVCQQRKCEKCGVVEYNPLPKIRSIDGLKNER